MSPPINDMTAYIVELTAIDKSSLPFDGGERFNRLIFARSPYLLQHAQNRVDWYEWGEAAFAKACSENLPILLSIGYATCHWCHVMAHESFEDFDVAALLNRHFVCIKVDREERPDIDDFYMTVSQLLTGSGGWPLNIFMAPDKRPFMAVTYLPKRKRDGMSGLMELLANIAAIWKQKPDMIEKNCREIMAELNTLKKNSFAVNNPDISSISERAMHQLSKLYDPINGGFGSSPKFPMPIYLHWLILKGDEDNGEPLEMALHTLRKMRGGGIWDQLGGGVHRYSVDPEWLAPHFEKMLYDQAMLALVLLEAFQATADPFFSGMADEIFTFAHRELLSTDGAFCSALDADSEGVEGKFYVWDKSEIAECLGAGSELFCRYFDLSEDGNFEGSNILNTPVAFGDFCLRSGLNPGETRQLLDRARSTLFDLRESRIRPLRDDKIITSWNGLMIAALARAGIVCEKPDYLERAARVATFLLTSLRRKDGRLLRSYLNIPSEIPAFLEDYAFLTFGLLELYEATLDTKWLDNCSMLVENMLQLFRDPLTGEFILTGLDAEQMPARVSSDHDGVTPSAFSVTAEILLRMAWICERPELAEYARSAVTGVQQELERNPLNHLGSLQILAMLESEPVIATCSGGTESPELAGFLRVLKRHTIPNLAIRREFSQEQATVSICANMTCHPAVTTPEQLASLLFREGLCPEKSRNSCLD
ncbi:MAG: thioredoxin domain-containing protein [Desulfuromonadaceae bacterium]|nr:thioredoxin domain-containing protein [Desulfuromonadaceae bacterium]